MRSTWARQEQVTERLRSGQRVRVDGEAGFVLPLE
jgi:hypothetical protein